MHWYILGAGAIGCLCAEQLARTGAQVTLILRDQPHLQQFEAVGRQITLREGDTRMQIRVGASRAGDSDPISHLLITTKAHATVDAINSLTHRLLPDAQIVLLQNGCGQQEQVSEQFPTARIWAGITTMGGWRDTPFSVVKAGAGPVILGPVTPGVTSLPDGWSAIEPAVLIEPDIQLTLWRKLAINCAINPLTALHGCCNGELISRPELSRLMQQVCEEVEQVARHRGLKLFDESLFTAAAQVARLTGDNYSSMLQDMQQGRPTEIEQITGFLCAEADRLGIATPLNLALLTRIRDRQPQQKQNGDGRD